MATGGENGTGSVRAVTSKAYYRATCDSCSGYYRMGSAAVWAKRHVRLFKTHTVVVSKVIPTTYSNSENVLP